MTPVLFELRDSRARMIEAQQRAEHERRVRVARAARRAARRRRIAAAAAWGRQRWRDYRARRPVRAVGDRRP